MAKSTTKGKRASEAEAPAPNGRLIKYMGDSDVRVILKGETFNGEYPEGVAETLEWNPDNGHVVDVEDDPTVIELLLEQPGGEFTDVTDLKRVPRNAWQDRWAPKGEVGMARNFTNAMSEDGTASGGGDPAATGNLADAGSLGGSGTD